MQLIGYFKDVIKELKIVEFPSYVDVRLTAIIILILLCLLMVFIGFSDFFISKLIKFLLGIM